MSKKFSVLIMFVLVCVLAMPAVVVAKGQKGGGKGAGAAASKEARGKAAEKAEDKAAAKAEKRAAKQERKQARSSEASGAEVPETEEFDPIETGKPGVAGAMVRITSNLERALDKVAAGTKKQLPPGLVKVWNKFAVWLGIDPTTQPGYVAPVDDSSPTTETTSTVEPTATVEPTPTVDPTATIDPIETPALLEQPAP